MGATSAFWFVVSHQLLFKLHLPNRYVGRFLLLIFVLLAALALIIFIDGLLLWGCQCLKTAGKSGHGLQARTGALLASGLATGLFAILVLYPVTYSGYPSTSLARGQVPDLYRFFATQPQNSVIASLSPEANNLPSFSGRSVLVSSEIAIPYHVTYYREIDRRARDLIEAHYTTNPETLRSFIERYGVTHWLLDSNAYNPTALNQDRWIQQYQPEAGEAISTLASRQTPVLQQVSDRCPLFHMEHYWVLDAACILRAIDNR